jgi:transcriptional regulatory protein RtcR
MRRRVAISFLGTTLDQKRGNRWRPNVALCQQPGLFIDRLDLIHDRRHGHLAAEVTKEIELLSPATKVVCHILELRDPWDFNEVYVALRDFTRSYVFDLDTEDYLVHITTGTHVAQICWFLLTEARFIPGRLLQLSPPRQSDQTDQAGNHSIIDLDLSRYDAIATRFANEREQATSFLKSGIATRNKAFNSLIDQIEHVAVRSKAPVLLSGPTGAGKSQLARKIFELKKSQHQVSGAFVEVNCATLRGDQAMSALFGHVRGAFTGAQSARGGLLKGADKGMLFLDEIGELGLDEQAMCLRAIEEKRFLPVGADKEVSVDFQLLAGSNRDLATLVREGLFREDLLARLNLWSFSLPALKDRPEDIEPNIAFELARLIEREGQNVTFNREARELYLTFALGQTATWNANFRDLSASITRMATLAPEGRIDEATVLQEVERLQRAWQQNGQAEVKFSLLETVLGADLFANVDLFDRTQLETVLSVCRTSTTISDAGRLLFAASRRMRSSINDADRLRKYLARFGLTFDGVRQSNE